MLTKSPLRIGHVMTTTVSGGGAESFSLRLMQALHKVGHVQSVLSLTDFGEIAVQLTSMGIKVTALNITKAKPWRVAGVIPWLLRGNFDVVQTWLYHSDLLAGVPARLLTRAKVIWNLRQADFSKGAHHKKTTLLITKVCAWLSHYIPHFIVSNSQRGVQAHEQIGYKKNSIHVIPNGFDVSIIKPEPEKKETVRQRLGISNTAWVIGSLSRFHLQKDHGTLLKAAVIVINQTPNTVFVLCGRGVSLRNSPWDKLVRSIVPGTLLTNFRFMDNVQNPFEIIPAIDIGLLASRGEGFPNSLAEFMACCVPCISTDAGDSALIVGSTGITTETQRPDLLADALLTMMAEGKQSVTERGKKARSHIEKHFSLDVVAATYMKLYEANILPAPPGQLCLAE